MTRATPGRRARTVAGAFLLAATAALSTASVAVGAPDQRTCHIREGVTHQDTLGNAFTKDLYCENSPGKLYARASFVAPVTGMLNSTTSWFVCWTMGEPHPGGNNVWYYTQGEETVQMPSINAWGTIPANHLWTDQDPYPGLPRCPWW
ncbi:hypothetical protein [Streptomyces leeuwenhoekii]|uniref:Secreted Protein n=1 Tax=Streptomyces leeuwenhoekii TaxID=1437453 RepID=A0A0F7VKT9_STRLW|nr:hypothetical protein [Streptomyces leeuwenhoekii]CQR59684.1 Hypothetical Protein sle_02220 [Streptomyces leeuwenhoekii]